FARRSDDIGDGTLPGQEQDMPAEEKIAALEQARSAVLDLSEHGSPDPDDPVLVALADTARTFPVPMAAFGELIDGCVADVRGTHYETFEDLHGYCRCSTGAARPAPARWPASTGGSSSGSRRNPPRS